MEPAMARLLAEDHGVRLVFKDLPILGPASVLGSKALLAAQKQGGYEKLREAVMHLPPNTTRAMIEEEAGKLGLDWSRLSHDMEDPAVQSRIQANLDLAQSLGIQGTPAFIVGGDLIPGAVAFDDLKKAVDQVRHGG